MKISISKVVGRMAVAAVVAAGVLGIVTAGPFGAGEEISTPTNPTLRALYEVVPVKELTTTAATTSFTKAAIMVDPEITEVSGPKNGNLGTVKVRTNAGGWDVKFKTTNGGQLMKGAKKWETVSKWDTDKNQMVTTGDSVDDPSQPKISLKYTDASAVKLKVAIGCLDKIGNSLVLKGLASGDVGTGTAYKPAVVTPGLLATSMDVLDASGSITTPATPVSFIDVLSHATTGLATDVTATDRVKIRVGGVSVTDAAGAAANGFGSTLDFQYTGSAKKDDSEYFFINVGVDDPTKAIGKNTEGKYDETFTFTLYGGF